MTEVDVICATCGNKFKVEAVDEYVGFCFHTASCPKCVAKESQEPCAHEHLSKDGMVVTVHCGNLPEWATSDEWLRFRANKVAELNKGVADFINGPTAPPE